MTRQLGSRPLTTLGPSEVLDADRWQPLRLPNGTVQTFATPTGIG
jgi:hypothetical protein